MGNGTDATLVGIALLGIQVVLDLGERPDLADRAVIQLQIGRVHPGVAGRKHVLEAGDNVCSWNAQQ